MSAQENKAVLLRFVEEFNRGNLTIVDEVFSPNLLIITPSLDWPTFPSGLEGARMMLNAMRDGAVEMNIEDIVAEEDRVAVRWTFTGIYRGEPRPGFPAPEEKITTGSMSFYRFVNGKIDRDWGLDIVSPTHDPWKSK
jgi:hypothetical protein